LIQQINLKKVFLCFKNIFMLILTKISGNSLVRTPPPSFFLPKSIKKWSVSLRL